MADPSVPAEPYRIELSTAEQMRLMSEALVRLHKMTNIVYEHRSELLPGELNEEFHRAWMESSETFRLIETVLAEGRPYGMAAPPGGRPLDSEFEKGGLASSTGEYERTALVKAVDWFLALWHGPEPKTGAQKQAAMRAGARAHNIGGVLLDSLSSVVQTSLPAAASAKAVSEFCSFTSHGLEVNAERYGDRRGHQPYG